MVWGSMVLGRLDPSDLEYLGFEVLGSKQEVWVLAKWFGVRGFRALAQRVIRVFGCFGF